MIECSAWISARFLPLPSRFSVLLGAERKQEPAIYSDYCCLIWRSVGVGAEMRPLVGRIGTVRLRWDLSAPLFEAAWRELQAGEK